MHPQYPAIDIKHLIDRLHTKGALRFLDLEISGPTELMPGVICEAAGGHTEGSMNVIVKNSRGRGDHLRRRALRHQRPARRTLPRDQRHGAARHRQPWHHQAQEKAAIKKVVASSRFVLPVHDRPAHDRSRTGRRPPAGLRSRPDRPVAAATQLVPGLSAGSIR